MEEFDFDRETAYARGLSQQADTLATLFPDIEHGLDELNAVGRDLAAALNEVIHTAVQHLDRYVEPASDPEQ